MDLLKAMTILSEHRDRLAKAALSEDRVIINPVVEAIDIIIEALIKKQH